MTSDVLGQEKRNLKIGSVAKMETVRSYAFLGSPGKRIQALYKVPISSLDKAQILFFFSQKTDCG